MSPKANDKQNSVEENSEQTAKSNWRDRRQFEMTLWMIIAFLVAIYPFSFYSYKTDSLFEYFLRGGFQFVLLGFTVFLVPLIFGLIFGALPLEAWRNSLARSRAERMKPPTPKISVDDSSLDRTGGITIHLDSNLDQKPDLSKLKGLELLAEFAQSSRQLADNLYTRSGVYLLIGVVIAFTGLVFFYIQTPVASNETVSQMILLLAPRFGILFFIELVAFFFLRQYRAALDEFRYYEAVKRYREELLSLVRICIENKIAINPIDLAKNKSFFSQVNTFSKNQTTDLLESKKLEGGDAEILGKLAELIAVSKR